MICLILFCAIGVFAQENLQNGVITDLTGTVELKASGRSDFVPAKAGDTLAKDTIVSTGFRSTALIKVGSTVLTVRPLTRLSLSEIASAEGTETINVSLQTGRVRADVKPPSGVKAVMTVQSPIATASVRGTSFEFDTLSITVLEGTVAFQGSHGSEMLVGAGSTSEIGVNNKPADPMETFTAELLPLPPAGNDTGFRMGEASAPSGEFRLGFDLL